MSYSDGPRVAVSVLLIKSNSFLMLKRKGSQGDGSWAVPGGAVEYGEDPKSAAERELLEETGVIGKNLRPLNFYSNDIHEEAQKHYVTLRFLCKEFTGEPQIAEPDKCSEIDWFTFDKLPSPLFEPTEKFLEWYIKNKKKL